MCTRPDPGQEAARMVRGTLHSLRGSDPGAWGSERPGACPHVRGDVHFVLGAWGRPWARHAPRRQKTGDLSSDWHPVPIQACLTLRLTRCQCILTASHCLGNTTAQGWKLPEKIKDLIIVSWVWHFSNFDYLTQMELNEFT